MELETASNTTTTSVRTKQLRTKAWFPLTKPQLDVHNAIHSYTKLLANRENSASTRSTGTTTLIPIKTTNKLSTNRDTITTTNNVKQIINEQKNMKSNNNTFIYQITHQHRNINNISSISDQTYNMTPLSTHQLQSLNDENNRLSKLRSKTSQSSATTTATVQSTVIANNNNNNNSNTQKLGNIKKPVKLNPLIKTNNKQQQLHQQSDVFDKQLQFIALHKPLHQQKSILNENKANKLPLFDANKVKSQQQHLKPKSNFKWSFNNQQQSQQQSQQQQQQQPQQQQQNDILTSIFKGDKIIVDNFKINKLMTNNKKRNEMNHLDDIDEDYMESVYNSKSIFDKFNDFSPRSNITISKPYQQQQQPVIQKQQNITKSTELTTTYDSDTDTLVSNSSLLSTSDKSCEVIYSCPINQKLQDERRTRAQIRKYKSRLNHNTINPEDMFYNNTISSSDEESKGLRKTNKTNAKKKNYFNQFK